MSKLEIRDLYINPSTPTATTKWDTVILNVEVSAGDYRVIRSKVGRELIYTIKYDQTPDPLFKENPNDPAPPQGQIPQRWNKMYRCRFNMNFVRGGAVTSPIISEENVTYPKAFPEAISMQAPPEGTQWPKDPLYRLYKNYKYPDPSVSTDLKKCDVEYTGEPHVFIQKLVNLLTKIDLEQKIRPTGEVAPPPPAQGQEESAEETAKRLKNYLKLHDVKDTLRAEYKILTVKEKERPPAQEGGAVTVICNIEKTEIKKIALRGLDCTDENKDDFDIVDLPIIRY
jgi:hypothetical protein